MLKPPMAPHALPSQTAIKNFLFIQTICFWAIGLDPSSIKRTIYRPWLSIIPLLAMIGLLGPMAMYAVNNLKMDLGKAISALSPFWQAILSIVKFFFFIVNRKKILQLLHDVWLWTLEGKS